MSANQTSYSLKTDPVDNLSLALSRLQGCFEAIEETFLTQPDSVDDTPFNRQLFTLLHAAGLYRIEARTQLDLIHRQISDERQAAQ